MRFAENISNIKRAAVESFTTQSAAKTVDDNKPSIMYTEGAQPVKNPVRPNSSLSFILHPTKHQAASFRQFDRNGVTYIDPRSGDILDIGMLPQRIKEDAERFAQNLKKSAEFSVSNMLTASSNNRDRFTIRDKYSDIYSLEAGWVLANSPQGMVAQNPNTGEYGIIQEDGSLKRP